jgi:hypothetical protein
MGEIKNPLETVLAGEVSRGFDEAQDLPGRVQRYGAAKARALLILTYLRSIRDGLPEADPYRMEIAELAAFLASCGNYLVFRHYYTVGKVRLSAMRSCKKHLICPLCAIRRGAKALKVYLDRYIYLQEREKTLTASLLTLTVRNGEDLGERFNHLQKSVRGLLWRRRQALAGNRTITEFEKVLGLVGTYEVTNKDEGKGWHPHAHMVVLHRERIDVIKLRREWKAITGDSHVFNIKPLKHPEDPAQDFVEVFKYAVKFSDLSLAHMLEAYLALSNRRLLYSAGLFWGVKVSEELTDELLDDLPYIELFYRYFCGKGYEVSIPKIA